MIFVIERSSTTANDVCSLWIPDGALRKLYAYADNNPRSSVPVRCGRVEDAKPAITQGGLRLPRKCI
jgi:hypothetical protein